MSSFQGVGIEGSTVYRGVLISEGWIRGVPLYTEVSSFQGVGIEGSTVYRGVLVSGGWNKENSLFCRFSHDRGACFVKRTVDTTGVFNLSRGLLFDPSAASLLGFLMGIEGTGRDDEWRIVTFNFASLLKRTCEYM